MFLLDNYTLNSPDRYNSLRDAAKYNKFKEIYKLREKLTVEEYISLLRKENEFAAGTFIIHYAAKYDSEDAALALLAGLTLQEQCEIAKLRYGKSGCTPLHFIANERCYRTARVLKQLIYREDNHSYWIDLLAQRQWAGETPLHYAARGHLVELLNIFSSGLTSEEWFELVLMKYAENDFNALVSYFVEIRNPEDTDPKIWLAIRGPMTEEAWVRLMLSICDNKLTIDYLLSRYTDQEWVKKLFIGMLTLLGPSELAQLKKNYKGKYPHILTEAIWLLLEEQEKKLISEKNMLTENEKRLSNQAVRLNKFRGQLDVRQAGLTANEIELEANIRKFKERELKFNIKKIALSNLEAELNTRAVKLNELEVHLKNLKLENAEKNKKSEEEISRELMQLLKKMIDDPTRPMRKKGYEAENSNWKYWGSWFESLYKPTLVLPGCQDYNDFRFGKAIKHFEVELQQAKKYKP